MLFKIKTPSSENKYLTPREIYAIIMTDFTLGVVNRNFPLCAVAKLQQGGFFYFIFFKITIDKFKTL